MRGKHIYGLAVFFFILVVVASLVVGSPVMAAGKIINLSMGSTKATSGVYAFGVAVAAAVSKYDPEIVNTVVESGGAYDNAKQMKAGIFHWSASGSPAVYHDVRTGTGGFEKYGAWEPIRLMFLRSINVARVYVRADKAKAANIRTWSDLKGMKFGPGMPGTRDMTRALDAGKILNANIEFVPGNLADAVNSLKEGRIVGMLKGSPVDNFDAAMIECHYGTPLTVIGFTREDAEKIQAVDPMNTFMQTPVGTIKVIPEAGGFYEMNSAVMTVSSSAMSQEVGYRIVKAVNQGWAEIAEAFAPCKGVDPVRDAISNTPNAEGFYYHAGVVQFAREIGIHVPERMVPPEYKQVGK